jgi:hypothetical protein
LKLCILHFQLDLVNFQFMDQPLGVFLGTRRLQIRLFLIQPVFGTTPQLGGCC